ncbi:MAG: hypothetical protein CM1200mP5_3930 [Candidatus Pelagibacterales bacterium]|nr:MAG: hypothetical protein CM1200mP5_3930 [Pelagibacterales bacterium]
MVGLGLNRKGSIECEHVISCSGNFARKTGKWLD